jgi:hypothetical protein
MSLRNNTVRYFLLLSVFGLAAIGCQKMSRPALGDYPKDTNPPGGPLKFYAALDGSAVDSIRANFGIVQDANFVDGVSQKAMQPDYSKKGYISFPSANDFSTVSDFSISLWLNATLDQKDHNNADGILAFGNSKNFWGNVTIFADHETSTSDSMILKFHFNSANNSDNWQAQYAGDKRLPHMYDGNWHNITITYNATSSVFTLYRDGVQFDQMTMSPGIKFENPSQLVLGGFQEAVGIVDNYGNNSWMAPFPGKIDQVRLYGVTLSASDVSTIYNTRH